MRNMKFAVGDLVEIIRANRETHHAIFEEAQVGYRKAVIKDLDERLREAREGKRILRAAIMREPEDHTRDYDRVLKMLDMCSESHVELNEDEFGQYVMDDWSWKRNFLFANSAYSTTATAALAEQNEDF